MERNTRTTLEVTYVFMQIISEIIRLNEPEIPLWCFNMYRGNNFEQLGATLVISGIFIGCLRYYGALIG